MEHELTELELLDSKLNVLAVSRKHSYWDQAGEQLPADVGDRERFTVARVLAAQALDEWVLLKSEQAEGEIS